MGRVASEGGLVLFRRFLCRLSEDYFGGAFGDVGTLQRGRRIDDCVDVPVKCVACRGAKCRSVARRRQVVPDVERRAR